MISTKFCEDYWRFQLNVRVHMPIYVRAVPTGEVLDNTLLACAAMKTHGTVRERAAHSGEQCRKQ